MGEGGLDLTMTAAEFTDRTHPFIPSRTKSFFRDRLFQINPNAVSPSPQKAEANSARPQPSPTSPSSTQSPVDSRKLNRNSSAPSILQPRRQQGLGDEEGDAAFAASPSFAPLLGDAIDYQDMFSALSP